ncbi:MAG: YARHG domain-containing protein [Prevotella sp.]|nr:YARHG domain-containing protein [Prevotella sp.]
MRRIEMILMMLCTVIAVRAQINEGLHWYNGQITFTARNIANKGVVMEAMDEGEEHEFVLRYVKEVNSKHHVYRTENGSNHRVNIYGVGTTVQHKQAEGWDVLCFYDENNRLMAVMSGEEGWDAQKLNEARWKNMMIGEYASETENDVELPIRWKWDALSFRDTEFPYEVVTFNGRVTGHVTVLHVEGASNELEGTWEVVPTLRGFRLYAVNTETGSSPWEWKRSGAEYEFAETNPDVGRFFYASTTLLNDHQFGNFDKSTLRIMRNAILARHGYRFQSKDLQEYFTDEPWYKPAASNDGIRLSFIEQLNVELIKQMEESE